MHTRITISLYSDEKKDALGFGRGVVELLERIRESGSIYRAAKDMHMAYSKAWTILRTTEAEFECKLLDRNSQKGSTLTPDAETLLTRYHAILSAAEAAAQKELDAIQHHA